MKTYFVFDVESIGLLGPAFAVGWVVIQENGKVLEERCLCMHGWQAMAIIASHMDQRWLMRNIPPMVGTHNNPDDIFVEFAKYWEYWKSRGAIMVADCPFPVESKFLIFGRLPKELLPYPLIDGASVRLGVGLDPLETCFRLSNELPAHNPLNDSRQSARLLLEALNAKV